MEIVPETPLRRFTRDELPESLRAGWDSSMKLNGEAAFVEVGANNLAAFMWYGAEFYGKLFYAGRLPRRESEIARLRLDAVNGCVTCSRSHSVKARDGGVTEEQMQSILKPSAGCFSAADRAAMALADLMHLANFDARLTPQLHKELRQHFSDGEIFELGLFLGLLSGAHKFTFTFGLVERSPTCPFQPRPDAP